MDPNLAEQLLLLGLRDAKGDTGLRDLGAGLAGAVLVELGECGALRLGDGKLHAVPVDLTHPVLTRAHGLVTADKPRSAKSWVSRLPRGLKPITRTVAEPLVHAGVLRREESTRFGFLRTTKHFPATSAPKDALRARLHDVLIEGLEPTRREALLIGLLVPMDLVKEVVPRVERKGATTRAKQLAESGVAGTAVADVVRDVQAAVLTAVMVSAVTAGVGGN